MGKAIKVFEMENKTVDGVIRNIEIIGEASKKIPAKVKLSNPLIPWE